MLLEFDVKFVELGFLGLDLLLRFLDLLNEKQVFVSIGLEDFEQLLWLLETQVELVVLANDDVFQFGRDRDVSFQLLQNVFHAEVDVRVTSVALVEHTFWFQLRLSWVLLSR